MSDELNRIFGPLQPTASYGVLEIIFCILLTCLLVGVIGWTYQRTYTGVTYSKHFYQTLVIMAVVTSVIMIIIGSNIARAFSLVGALSIVRFRTAVKDGKETAFVFFAIAVGMACGTRLYVEASILTFMLCGISYGMHRLQVDRQALIEEMLRVRFAAGSFQVEEIEDAVLRFCRYCVHVGTEQLPDVDEHEVSFIVHDFDRQSKSRLTADLDERYQGVQVSLVNLGTTSIE